MPRLEGFLRVRALPNRSNKESSIARRPSRADPPSALTTLALVEGREELIEKTTYEGVWPDSFVEKATDDKVSILRKGMEERADEHPT